MINFASFSHTASHIYDVITYKLTQLAFRTVVKIDFSKRLAFLLYDFKLISNQQQLISKTDTYVQSM